MATEKEKNNIHQKTIDANETIIKELEDINATLRTSSAVALLDKLEATRDNTALKS